LLAPVYRSHGSCSRHGGTKPASSRSSDSYSWAWALGSAVQYNGASAGSGEPSLWLAPSITRGAAGAMAPAYTGALVSLVFQ
jgi:hypothetical protein